MLPDRSHSIAQTTAKGNKDPGRTGSGGGREHGAQDRTWTKPVHHKHNGASEACGLGWRSGRASWELQVRREREAQTHKEKTDTHHTKLKPPQKQIGSAV